MSYEQKRSAICEMVDNLYGDDGMAVLNLMLDYMTGNDWEHLYNRLEHDGAFNNED